MSSLAGATPFLSVCHSFLTHECQDITPDQDKQITELLHHFVVDCNISHNELMRSIADILGHAVEFPNQIRDILAVPDDPPPGHGLKFLSEDGTRRQNPWSKVEDDRLLCAIYKFGVQNWSTVSSFVGFGRSRAQCSQRWNRGLNPDLRKLDWSAEEEEQLRELVARYGVKSWTKIAHEMGTRSDIQCRYHFLQVQRNRRNDHSKRMRAKPGGDEQSGLKKPQTPSTWDLFGENENGEVFPRKEVEPFNPFF